MHFNRLFSVAFSVAALVSSVIAAEVEEITEPEIVVIAAFPETNAFSHVVNGEKNSLTLSVENKSDRNVTLLSAAGSLHHPDTDALIKNLTALEYRIPLLEGGEIKLPYVFYSEFKTGDARLKLWLEHECEDRKYRASAYDSVITIVEPEISWLDWKMWTTYLVVSGVLGALTYFAYVTFVPQPRKRSRKPAPTVSAPIGVVTATGPGGYQEEWIPEHHLRKGKKSKKQAGAASGTSADELSGVEVSGSGNEARKRKGRK